MSSFDNPRYGKVLRTPDDRFQELPNFPYAPHYLQFRGLRIHYLDEKPVGPSNNKVCLCLHGEPTWSYLYRKMIPVFLKHGYRVIVPDFIGFGRSDKLVEEKLYSFYLHRDTIMWLIEQLELFQITLVCQDWGGAIGLTIPLDMPKRFTQLIVMNTGFTTGDMQMTEGFKAWKKFALTTPDMDVGQLIQKGTPLTSEEIKAYNAPFPDVTYKKGVRIFPALVCESPDAEGAQLSRRAVEWWSTEWTGKAFMAIGVKDPVIGVKPMLLMRMIIANCSEPLMVQEAGHFVQEWGDQVALKALQYFGDLSNL